MLDPVTAALAYPAVLAIAGGLGGKALGNIAAHGVAARRAARVPLTSKRVMANLGRLAAREVGPKAGQKGALLGALIGVPLGLGSALKIHEKDMAKEGAKKDLVLSTLKSSRLGFLPTKRRASKAGMVAALGATKENLPALIAAALLGGVGTTALSRATDLA